MRISGAALILSYTVAVTDARAFVWPSSIDKAARDLSAQDVAIRRHAARELRLLPPASIRRLGLHALEDSDPDVRVAALESLLDAHVDGLGVTVAGWLGDPDPRVRRVAADTLARQPFPGAVAALGRILADPDPTVRVAAAKALGASGGTAAVVPLLGRLDDTEADVREAVTTALARIGDKSAVVPLVGKIQDSRPSVRRSVAVALGALGDARASSALALSLRDSDETVRVAALEALGRLRAEDAVVTIVPLLEEERRPAVREAALAALSAIPSDAGLDALVRALATDEPRERSPVRAALVRAGERAVPKLVACLGGQPSSVQADGCALALGEIGTAPAVDAIEAALRRGTVGPPAALKALGASGDGRALGAALEFLSSEDPLIRHAALEAAGHLLDPRTPDGRAVEPILRALDAAHARRSERAALVALLGKTGSPRAAPVLMTLVADATDPALRLSAVEALGLIGRAGQDGVLLDALSDERPGLRLSAALSLRRTASASTASSLLDRLQLAADQDRGALGIALLGPLAVTSDRKIVDRVAAAVRSSDGADRDVLIEALGAVAGTLGSAPLVQLLHGADVPMRAKIAEALAAHPEAAPSLADLARDPAAFVRANAVWSLGSAGGVAALPTFSAALADRDPSVSGDAAAALGRLGARGVPVLPTLCGLLVDERPYTRANALAGLVSLHARCSGVERALESDPFDFVRAAAATLVSGVPSTDPTLDALAVARCAAEEPNAEVAARCAVSSVRALPNTDAVSVYVVPNGATLPAPHVPFALVRADGFVRLGLTDARGSVYERDAPGPIHLGIPAALLF